MIESPYDKDELIARYLLNELSESENEELEDEMVLDGRLAERRQTVEMNLIDSYVMGEMSPDERLRFRNGFLLFPENRAKVEEARALHESLRLLRKEQAEGREKKPEGQVEQPTTLPGLNVNQEPSGRLRRGWFGLLSRPAFALVAFAVALGLGYFFIPWRDLLGGRTGNQNVAVNPSPQATPGSTTQHNAAPNGNNPADLDGNQSPPPAPTPSTPEPPEVALLTPPEVIGRMIDERPGLIPTDPSRGSGTGQAKAQPVTFPAGSKRLSLTVKLRQDRPVENNAPVSVAVYSFNDLEKPIFPARGSLLLTPRRTGGRGSGYVVTVEIPTALLRDGRTYYVRINEEPKPTAFKVTMTGARR